MRPSFEPSVAGSPGEKHVRDRVAVKADLNAEMAAAVREAAEADHRSVAGWVRVQLAKALDTERNNA